MGSMGEVLAKSMISTPYFEILEWSVENRCTQFKKDHQRHKTLPNAPKRPETPHPKRTENRARKRERDTVKSSANLCEAYGVQAATKLLAAFAVWPHPPRLFFSDAFFR